eukprot:4276240-Amphidinium_carterae.1
MSQGRSTNRRRAERSSGNVVLRVLHRRSKDLPTRGETAMRVAQVTLPGMQPERWLQWCGYLSSSHGSVDTASWDDIPDGVMSPPILLPPPPLLGPSPKCLSKPTRRTKYGSWQIDCNTNQNHFPENPQYSKTEQLI